MAWPPLLFEFLFFVHCKNFQLLTDNSRQIWSECKLYSLCLMQIASMDWFLFFIFLRHRYRKRSKKKNYYQEIYFRMVSLHPSPADLLFAGCCGFINAGIQGWPWLLSHQTFCQRPHPSFVQNPTKQGSSYWLTCAPMTPNWVTCQSKTLSIYIFNLFASLRAGLHPLGWLFHTPGTISCAWLSNRENFSHFLQFLVKYAQ